MLFTERFKKRHIELIDCLEKNEGSKKKGSINVQGNNITVFKYLFYVIRLNIGNW